MTKKLKDVVKSFAEVRLTKATMDDKRSILQQKLRMSFEPAGEFDWLYLVDFDEDYVYFEVYDYDNGTYLHYRVGYEFNGTNATFSEDVEEVVRNTSYEVVQPMNDAVEGVEMERSLLKKFADFLDKHAGGSNRQVEQEEICVIKVKDEEQQISIEPLYVAYGEVDGHGDTPESVEVLEKMCESFNKAVDEGRMQSGLFHKHLTKGFTPIRAWVAEEDEQIGEEIVKAGQPLVEIQYHSKDLWDLRKSGEISGPSIGAKGTVEVVE